MALCRLHHVTTSVTTGAGRTIEIVVEKRIPEVESLVGIHRIQRIPANDKRGRRHTSTATVAVLDEADDVAVVVVREEDIRIKTKRGTGAGGQHRNVTDSAVEVLHRPTGLVVQIDSGRSQHQNVERALAVLTERLAKAESTRLRNERNSARVRQIATAERPSKDWTWNTQRGEVLCHSTGERHEMSRLLRGRI